MHHPVAEVDFNIAYKLLLESYSGRFFKLYKISDKVRTIREPVTFILT